MLRQIFSLKLVVFLLLFGIVSILPFFRESFFTMHDDTQVARVSQMGEMLSQGVFPVRWVPDLGYGYGYPIFNFYAPLAYYVGGVITLFGSNALIATKSMMVLSILFSGIGMYLFGRKLWGELAGLVAGLLYLFAPYHALNVYVRGDAAELYAYALLPFLFWSGWRLYTQQTRQNLVLTSVFYALIILSHNLSAMMITPFFLVFSFGAFAILRKQKKKNTQIFLVLAPLLGILLASFYWLPVFFEMKYTNVLSQVGGAASFRDHFVCVSQLWSSPWLYGGSIPGCVDGMSYRIGKVHILLGIMGIVSGILFQRKNKEKRIISLLFTTGLLISILLLLPISSFVWEKISFMAFFQYPWRFLLMTSFFISLLGASTVWYIKSLPNVILSSLFRVFLVIFIVVTLLVTSVRIFVPQTYLSKTNEEYIDEKGIKQYASSLTDEYLPPAFIRPKDGKYVTKKFSLRSGNAKITNEVKEGLSYSANVVANSKSEILVHHAYFPTWHVYINGKMSEFAYFNRGLIVTVPKGTYNIVVKYSQTPVELLANSISLVTVGILLFIIFYPKIKQKYAK